MPTPTTVSSVADDQRGPGGARAVDGHVAQGGQRRHPLRPDGRRRCRRRGDDEPDERGDDQRRGAAASARRRAAAKPKASNIALRPLGDADAGHRRRRSEATTPTSERLQDHRAEHLAPVGADGPQQRRLPRALGDEDREGVVDAEGRHQQGDAGEHAQEACEEAEEVGC